MTTNATQPGKDRVKELQEQLEALEMAKATEIKSFYENYDKTVRELADIAGTGHHWQAEDGTVFQIVEPDGRFVRFDRYGVARTRYAAIEERAGTLSLTAARDLGYEVEGKKAKGIESKGE